MKTAQLINPQSVLSLNDNPNYWWKYANLSFSQSEYKKSIYALDKISNYVKNDDMEHLYAKSYQKLGEYELAEKHFKKAIAMYPSKYACRYELMLLYKKIGRYDDGASIAKEIIQMPQKVSSGFSFFVKKSAKKYLEEHRKKKV